MLQNRWVDTIWSWGPVGLQLLQFQENNMRVECNWQLNLIWFVQNHALSIITSKHFMKVCAQSISCLFIRICKRTVTNSQLSGTQYTLDCSMNLGTLQEVILPAPEWRRHVVLATKLILWNIFLANHIYSEWQKNSTVLNQHSIIITNSPTECIIRWHGHLYCYKFNAIKHAINRQVLVFSLRRVNKQWHRNKF